MSSYKPTLEYFTSAKHLTDLVDPDIPGVSELHEEAPEVCDRAAAQTDHDSSTCACCGVTVQGEIQRFMELQEAGLRTDFRCKQCRNCDDCRRGAGHEKLSLKQEAEQELVKESVVVDAEKGIATARLPFTLSPEENLKNNRHIALKLKDRVLKKHCSDPDKRATICKAWQKMIDKKHLVFMEDLTEEQQEMLAKAAVSYWIPWNLQFKESISTPIRPVFNASS